MLEGVAYVELEVDAGGVVGEEVGGTGHGRGWWWGSGLGDIVHPPLLDVFKHSLMKRK